MSNLPTNDTPRATANCSPFWYAVTGFLATPLLVAILLLGAILFTVAWPLVPVVFYLKRKEERRAI